MAVLVVILRMGDGGMDGIMRQIDGWLLAATSLSEGGVTSVPSMQVVSLWPFLIMGGLLAAAVAVFRSSAGDDGVSTRKHLAIQYQLQAKDLDA